MTYFSDLASLPKTKDDLSPPPVVSYFNVTFFPGYFNGLRMAKVLATAITHLRIEEAFVFGALAIISGIEQGGRGVGGAKGDVNLLDFRFNKVSGLSSTIETDTIRVGGFNTEQLILPSHVTHPNLVLERGFLTAQDSITSNEITVAMDLMAIMPGEIMVTLLKPDGSTPISAWLFRNAYLVAWSNSDLASDDSDIFMEKWSLPIAIVINLILMIQISLSWQGDNHD